MWDRAGSFRHVSNGVIAGDCPGFDTTSVYAAGATAIALPNATLALPLVDGS